MMKSLHGGLACRNKTATLILTFVLILLQQGIISADEPAIATQPATEAKPEAVDGAPLRGPQYAPLRYNDDFSYLDGPEGSYEPDFFDPIKRIHLSDDLTLRLGGEIRGRLEAVTNKRYGAGNPRQDTFFLHRYYYHADFQYRKLFRFYVEGINAAVEDRDGTPIPVPSDHFDLHQMLIDVRVLGEETPLTLRVGRQELQYGKQRLVSPLDWANVRRTWDGVKLFWSDENWDIDGWYVHPVKVLRNQFDDLDDDIHFYGLYTTYKGIENHGIDAYYLGLRNEGRISHVNLPPPSIQGDMTLHTIGARFWGRTAVADDWWDYDTEVAGQWGSRSGDLVQAWMWSAETGYTFTNCPWTPRIGLGLDYASGDTDPSDDSHQTFNQLFPLGHAYFGYLDQIGRQNIWAQNVNLTMKPHKQVTTRLAWHTFWLNRGRDALYNAGGAPVRRDPTANADTRVGHELDLTVNWKLDAHTSLLFGYSHLWAGPFIRATGSGEDPDLFYIQYQYKF